MNDTLNRDLNKISEWGRITRVDFNARKTQCCVLTHRHAGGQTQSEVYMDGINIKEADTLDVLGMKRQSDVRWMDHVFQVPKEAFKCLGFLNRCRNYFTSSNLLTIYTTYIRPKMERNYYIWAGDSASTLEFLDRVEKRVKMIINVSSLSSFIQSLEHRRYVGCVTLFYRYYNGKCANEIAEFIPQARIFQPNTRLSSRAHSYVVDCPKFRTTHYRENSFFSRTNR